MFFGRAVEAFEESSRKGAHARVIYAYTYTRVCVSRSREEDSDGKKERERDETRRELFVCMCVCGGTPIFSANPVPARTTMSGFARKICW